MSDTLDAKGDELTEKISQLIWTFLKDEIGTGVTNEEEKSTIDGVPSEMVWRIYDSMMCLAGLWAGYSAQVGGDPELISRLGDAGYRRGRKIAKENVCFIADDSGSTGKPA